MSTLLVAISNIPNPEPDLNLYGSGSEMGKMKIVFLLPLSLPST
jgi:hypothetical protein